MDGARRHFDDIDGCGGPPVGELISIDGGGGGGALSRLRPRSGPRPVGDQGVRRRRGRGAVAGAALPPQGVGAGLDAGRRLAIALVVTFAASAVAYAIVTLVEGDLDVFDPVVPSLLRRLALPFSFASLAFHVVAFAGLLMARRGNRSGPNPLRPPTRFAGEDLLRGGIAFLLALFAASFLGSAGQRTGVRWSDIPLRADGLLVVEALLLVLVAPVVQERLFRGLLLVALRERFGPVVGVLGQAAIAGAALGWQAAPGARGVTAFAAFASSAVFGWFAHTTEDLRPGMLGHAFLGLWTVVGRFGS
jgi:membrane protease YdiL (CAAX protease family)